MNLFATAFRPLQTLLRRRAGPPTRPRRPPAPGAVVRDRFGPRLEALEERTVPDSAFRHIDSVQIVALHQNLRVAPGTPLQLVVQVTGEERNGNQISRIGTAQQLAVEDGVAVDFYVVSGGNRHVILTEGQDFNFLLNGVVTVLPGSAISGVGIVVSAGSPDLNEPPVVSPPFQLVRDNRVSNKHTFDGDYAGTAQGSFQAGSSSGPVPALPVHFRIQGRTMTVDQPGAFAGGISPNFTGEFAFGNGGFPFSVTVAGFTVSGTATFHIGLTKLSTFAVLCGGDWTFTGNLPDGTTVTARGSWNAQFLG
jgi:hypothetical protein